MNILIHPGTCCFYPIQFLPIYERLVFQYAQNYYQYKKEGSNQSIIEMKKCIGAMKLAGSEHIAKTYEAHLKKLIEENS